MRVVTNILCFGFVGYILADMGYFVGSIEWWMIVVPMLIVQIVNDWS